MTKQYEDTDYYRVHTNAGNSTHEDPLPTSAVAFWPRMDDTQRSAMVLWLHGWIASRAYTGVLMFPPGQGGGTPFVVGWHDVAPGVDKPRNIGRKCPECRKRKPLTADFWYRNAQGRDGWYSICKVCKRQSERDRYQQR